jgi:L-fucose mutarotase
MECKNLLKHIDPLLTAELLWILASMGHGDDLALVDANFPAEAVAASTTSRRLVRLPGLRMGAVAQAILSLLPVDDFTADPLRRMLVVDDTDMVPPVQQELADVVTTALGHALPAVGIDRFDFYTAARQAFAVVQVGDVRFYGNLLIRKGAIAAT